MLMTLRYPPKDAFYRHSSLHAEALYRAIGYKSEWLFKSFIFIKSARKLALRVFLGFSFDITVPLNNTKHE